MQGKLVHVNVKLLDERRNKLLLDEELDWHIKIRETWIPKGDNNTKYFHNFSSSHKIKNTIWDLTNEGGGRIHSVGESA